MSSVNQTIVFQNTQIGELHTYLKSRNKIVAAYVSFVPQSSSLTEVKKFAAAITVTPKDIVVVLTCMKLEKYCIEVQECDSHLFVSLINQP